MTLAKDNSFQQNVGSNDWSLFYWILGTILMPIALPLVVFRLLKQQKSQKLYYCLPGKVVLITGASSGLGEALAHVFYEAGCKVILAARRVDELERVKKELLAIDIAPVAYAPTILKLDLSELNSIPEFVRSALAVHNQIDFLVNNGGISVRSDVVSSAVDVDLKVMLVNYFGTVALTKAILPSMIQRKSGHVTFISSVQGKFALPHRSAYSASKHALQAFADSLRAEVTNKGLSVTTISPGYIRTHLSENALTSNGVRNGKMDTTTANGMNPEKVAKNILIAILDNKKDVIISNFQAKAAYYTRILLPDLYFWIMKRRAIKLEKEN